MSDPTEELRNLRTRALELSDRVELAERAAVGRTAYQVNRVFNNGEIGTEPGLFYATHVAEILGGAAEGDLPTVDVDDSATPVLVRVLDGVPAVGDLIVSRAVSYRWEGQKIGMTTGDAKSNICALIKNCGGGPGEGVLVTVTGGGGFLKTCTTPVSMPPSFSSGFCCVPVTKSGVYTVTVDGQSQTITIPPRAQANYIVSFCLTPGKGTVCVQVTNQCGVAAVGLPVTASRGGSGTTDRNGRVCICTSIGSGTLTSTPPAGYNPISVPYTVTSECSGQQLLFTGETLAPGYGEVCCGCGPNAGVLGIAGGSTLPVLGPLNLIDPIFGASTLTWSPASHSWKGTSPVHGWTCTVAGFACTMAPTSASYEFGRPHGLLSDPCVLTIGWSTTALAPCFGPVSGTIGIAMTTSSCPPAYSCSGGVNMAGTEHPYCSGPSTIVIFQ